MTTAQENQLLLEHKFLAKVKDWLDTGGSGYLTENAAELAVRELWEHWVGVMHNYDNDRAKDMFLRELDDTISILKNLQRKLV